MHHNYGYVIIPLMLIKHKEKNHSLFLTEKFNTVSLIGINLYSVLFSYFSFSFLNTLLNRPIVPENKTQFVLFVYYMYL